jgi:hypothetical protein
MAMLEESLALHSRTGAGKLIARSDYVRAEHLPEEALAVAREGKTPQA